MRTSAGAMNTLPRSTRRVLHMALSGRLHDGRVWAGVTFCMMSGTLFRVTADPDAVTCKRCLRKMGG